ncbi:antitoxin VbhA family protein [Arthrobacter dokdonensis]|uniref:antitoxin VbhA family protein n=1 Tax=Arthrobacter dokdonellae TaxID=2211210 RepID=UPI001494B94B|nr:hypothetical protein [Arthrobacter dokdonellae]
MSESLNARMRWPDIFTTLTPLQAQAVEQSLVAAWHEGVEPSVEHVRDLAARSRGEMSFDAFRARVVERAKAAR